MTRNILLLLVSCLIGVATYAQERQQIVVPDFDDKYSRYIKDLEAGNMDIDYQDFRFSLIESQQYAVIVQKMDLFSRLSKRLYKEIEEEKYTATMQTAKEMLSIDYTSMIAHKILRQTYQILGDTTNAIKYRTIQFGLLKSIVVYGNGESCATAWPVVQVAEEYFILNMLKANLLKQRLGFEEGVCDVMETQLEDGTLKTYYFDVSKVFEGYEKLKEFKKNKPGL
ncbi:DUF4919 domain-containing protein [Sphingobacterium sp. MYb382]|uniref:DUF4919 domain-containing protein n=1 Tax=Sphingobacterium sp. MYb382 TaxID=2745278 RepID=UPI00309C274D